LKLRRSGAISGHRTGKLRHTGEEIVLQREEIAFVFYEKGVSRFFPQTKPFYAKAMTRIHTHF
jgi:hypothetical protein